MTKASMVGLIQLMKEVIENGPRLIWVEHIMSKYPERFSEEDKSDYRTRIAEHRAKCDFIRDFLEKEAALNDLSHRHDLMEREDEYRTIRS
jgi:hypothetical protein